MRRSEVSTANSTQVLEDMELPEQIKDDLECIQDILRDNPEFFNKLIKECMKVGKIGQGQSVFFEDVAKLWHVEYPDLTTYTDGYKLISTTYDLVKQLCRHHGDNRNQLEYVIEEIFLNGDIGDINEQI